MDLTPYSRFFCGVFCAGSNAAVVYEAILLIFFFGERVNIFF